MSRLADVPAELREQVDALQAAKLAALREGRSVLPIAAELRELFAYIDARPWEDGRGSREPGEGRHIP